MSLEGFIGMDQGEGMDAASFEKFKEKMKRAQAQIKQIKKEEKKRKKKEDELIKFLLRFVKNSQKKELTLLISRALEQNLPANFILAIILLSNEDVKTELGGFLMLKTEEKTENLQLGEGDNAINEISAEEPSPEEKALIFFGEDETIPLKVRIELDAWVKAMLYQANETPEKLLSTSYDIEIIETDDGVEQKRTIKTILIQLTAFIIREFLEQHNMEENYEKLRNLAEFLIKGILEKTQDALDNRKMLGASED